MAVAAMLRAAVAAPVLVGMRRRVRRRRRAGGRPTGVGAISAGTRRNRSGRAPASASPRAVPTGSTRRTYPRPRRLRISRPRHRAAMRVLARAGTPPERHRRRAADALLVAARLNRVVADATNPVLASAGSALHGAYTGGTSSRGRRMTRSCSPAAGAAIAAPSSRRRTPATPRCRSESRAQVHRRGHVQSVDAGAHVALLPSPLLAAPALCCIGPRYGLCVRGHPYYAAPYPYYRLLRPRPFVGSARSGSAFRYALSV